MKFKMNGIVHNILEKSQEELCGENGHKHDNKHGYYMGSYIPKNNEIWLLGSLCKSQKNRVLLHELMHCYVDCFIARDITKSISEEQLCDISANSHDIIHKIYEDYSKYTK